MTKELSPQQCYQTAVEILADMVLTYLARKPRQVSPEVLEWILDQNQAEECQQIDIQLLCQRVFDGPWQRVA